MLKSGLSTAKTYEFISTDEKKLPINDIETQFAVNITENQEKLRTIY